MSIGLATRGYYSSGGGGGGGGGSPPVITIISTPVLDTDPLIVQVYDDTGLAFYELTCQDTEDSPRYVAYDPESSFIHPFDGRSTRTGAGSMGNPYVFTLYRRGRWPTNLDVDVKVRAVDFDGNNEVD